MTGRRCSISNMTCTIVDEGRLQLLDCIGRGSFGAVYRARDLIGRTPSLLAVKIVSKNSKLLSYWREVSAMHRVRRHRNVVAMHHWFHDEAYIYIVMDYCAGGDMWGAIRDRKLFSGNDALVKKIFLQIVDGLRWCHSRGVYHRDLTPNNILISHDCTKIWISDFGLATGTMKSFNFCIGSQNYRSPECNNMYGSSAPFDAIRNDIWSLGVILVNMLTGLMPWSVASKEDGWYMAFARDRNFLRYTLPISRETDHILQRIFAENPDDVIGLDALFVLVRNVEHFWMDGAEVAAGARHLQRALSLYRRDKPLSLPATSWDFDSHYVGSVSGEFVDQPAEHSIRSPSPLIPELTSPAVEIRVHSAEPEDAEVNWSGAVASPARTSAAKAAGSSCASSTHSVGSVREPGCRELKAGTKGKRSWWSLRRQVKRFFAVRAE